MLDDDGHAQETRGREHIHQSGFESNWASRLVRHRAASRERFVPYLNALRFAQLDVTDRAQEALQELSACRKIKTLERIRKQLEIHILDRQTRGRKGAGAGHIRNKPNLCLSPRGLGQACKLFYNSLEQPRGHSYWTSVALDRDLTSRKRGDGSTKPTEKRAKIKKYLCAFVNLVTKLPRFTIQIQSLSGYSSGWMNCKPKRRMSPAIFWRSTRARMGGVSLGTRLFEAGEGAGMVNCTV